jgi:hypothetical protein
MEKIFRDFIFDGRTLISTKQRASFTLEVDHWMEIGIEIIHDGSFPSNFCLVINRRAQNVRIPNDAPVVKALLNYFVSLEGFDWQPLVDIRVCADRPYALCWRRRMPSEIVPPANHAPAEQQPLL